MGTIRLRDALPAVYRVLLPPLFDREIPRERLADCSACAMVAPDGDAAGALVYFSPRLKCCTFHPTLANYQVGLILNDDDPGMAQGREVLRERILGGEEVSPAGIFPPPGYLAAFLRESPSTFGRSERLRCAFLREGDAACSIWPQRAATCATWFCRYLAGVDGAIFWKTLREYEHGVRLVLSEHVLRRLGWPPGEAADLSMAFVLADALQAKESPPERVVGRIGESPWRGWGGRAEAFFREAAGVVTGLSAGVVADLCGDRLEPILRRLGEALERMLVPRLPGRLRRNPGLMVQCQPDGSYLVAGDLTPFRVSARLLAIVGMFDGADNDTVRGRIMAEHGVSVADSLLLALYRDRVLVAA